MSVRPLLLTLTALVAFAANSVLCRLALGQDAVDPYTFTAIRILSGALMLLVVRRGALEGGSWKAAGCLLLYALPFSLAYVRVTTGTGALLLFGAVQLTMIGAGLRAGERPPLREWVALGGALIGVAYLVSPGLSAPDPLGAALMLLAGVGWGLYSVLGKQGGDPTATTAANFGRAALLVLPVGLAGPWLHVTPEGAGLALVSGAVTSGLGYAIWYAALRHLTATRAALVQLAVPVLAAAGGVALLAEDVTGRLVVASVLILGSIAWGVIRRGKG